MVWRSCELFCNAIDDDNDKISYLWEAPAGEFTIINDTAIWIAPDSVGYYHISCIVQMGMELQMVLL